MRSKIVESKVFQRLICLLIVFNFSAAVFYAAVTIHTGNSELFIYFVVHSSCFIVNIFTLDITRLSREIKRE